MNFYIVRIFITIILIISKIQNIKGSPTNNLKPNDNNANLSKSANINSNNEPSTSLIPEDTSNLFIETIKFELHTSYTHKVATDETTRELKTQSQDNNRTNGDDNKVVLFTYYSYHVDKNNQTKSLKDSKGIQNITFNDKNLPFDSSLKFPPEKNTLNIIVFVCKHNQPVMVRFEAFQEGETSCRFSYHYYYSLDSETEKFKNVKLSFLEEESKTDRNGLIYYPGQDKSINIFFAPKVSKEVEEKFNNTCRSHELTTETLDKPPLEMTIVLLERRIKRKNTNIIIRLYNKCVKTGKNLISLASDIKERFSNLKNTEQQSQENHEKEQSEVGYNYQSQQEATQKQSNDNQEQTSQNLQSQPESIDNTPEAQTIQATSTNDHSVPLAPKNNPNVYTEIIKPDLQASYEYKEISDEAISNEQKSVKTDKSGNEPTVLTYISYYINGTKQLKGLNESTNLEYIKFNNKDLPIDSSLRFPPPKDWLYVVIFLCKHNQPVIVAIKINESNNVLSYYYWLDSDTGKFKNTQLNLFKGQQGSNSNGLARDSTPSGITIKDYCEKILDKVDEKCKATCRGRQTIEAPNKPPLEISIILSEEEFKKRKEIKEKKAKKKNKTNTQ